MIKNYDINWSRRSTTTPKTEQGFIILREWARKKAIELAVKRYFDGLEGARKLRVYGDYPKKPISNQQYQALVTLQKTELGKSLSNLLRKGDKINVPQTSV